MIMYALVCSSTGLHFLHVTALSCLGNYFQCLGVFIKWNQVLIICREGLSIPSYFPAGQLEGKFIFISELKAGFVFLFLDKIHQALWLQVYNKTQTLCLLFTTPTIDLFGCSVSNLAHHAFIMLRSKELLWKEITALYDKDYFKILRLST